MPKGNKSSASSGTRKKNARKAATKDQPAHAPHAPAQQKEKKPKGKQAKALAKAEPKKKVYVPPPKPVKPQPDPLDAQGIAHQLPPELVVVLRALGKKDPVTKAKALDELNSRWIDEAARENGEEVTYALVAMIPVWFHRLPVLFTHPARRIRLLAASVHSALLFCSPAVRTAAFSHLADSADHTNADASLGTWLLLAHDLDRVVVTQAERSWRSFVSYDASTSSAASTSPKLQITPDALRSITSFTERVLLSPLSVHAALNPAAPEAPPPPAARGGKGGRGGARPPPLPPRQKEPADRPKAEGDEEQDADKSARLRYAALGALRWILDARKALNLPLAELYPLLRNRALWGALHPAARAPFVDGGDGSHQEDRDSFGHGQPQVRVAAWTLVLHLLQLHGSRSSDAKGKVDERNEGDLMRREEDEEVKEEEEEKHLGLEPLLGVLGPAVLRSAWVETDPGVRSAITRPVLVFLKEYPHVWLIDAEAGTDARAVDRDDEGDAEPEDDEDGDGEDEHDEDDSDDNDDEAPAASKLPAKHHPPMSSPIRRQPPSPAYTDFLSYLALGCAGSPIEGYPTALIVLSTIPSSIIAASASASASSPSHASSQDTPPQPPPQVPSSSYEDALHALFAAFWAALDGRALSMSAADRKGPARAFLGALLECLVFIVKRVRRSSSSGASAAANGKAEAEAEVEEAEPDKAAKDTKEDDSLTVGADFLPRLVAEQLARVWDALEARRLRLDAVDAGTLVGGALGALERLDAADAAADVDVDTDADARVQAIGGEDEGKITSGASLFDAAFEPLSAGARRQTPGATALAPAFLRVLLQAGAGRAGGVIVGGGRGDGAPRTQSAVRGLVTEAVGACLGACEEVLGREHEGCAEEGLNKEKEEKEVGEKVGALARWLDAFGAGLFEYGEFCMRTDDLAITHAPLLLSACPAFALAYLALRSDRARTLEMWHALLAGVALAGARTQTPAAQRTRYLETLLDADEKGSVPAHVTPDPEADELDRVVEEMVDACIAGRGERAVVRRVLARPDHFLSARGIDTLTHVLAAALAAQVESALYEPDFVPANLDVLLDFVAVVLSRTPTTTTTTQMPSTSAAESANDAGIAETLLPAVFVAAYLLPRTFPALAGDVKNAEAVWTAWITGEGVGTEVKEAVVGIVKGKLANVVQDCEPRARPEDVLALAAARPPGFAFDVLADFFPTRAELEGMLASLPAHAADPSLALLEPAILPPGPYDDFTSEPPSPTQEPAVDSRGYGLYARIVSALVAHALDDRRRIAREETWVLPHALRLSVLVQDFVRVPGAANGGVVFGPEALHSDVEVLVARAQTLATYVFAMAASADEGEGEGVRHGLITKACLPPAAAGGSKGASATLTTVERMIVDAVERAKARDEVRESRVLYALLQHLYADADTSDAEHWLTLARRLEKTAPQTALTIVAALTAHAPEPVRLDRYRNELAADALGVKPAQASTAGLLLLRRLVATAPDPESDVVFLPQQRAVNVMRACQAWIAGAAEEEDEEDGDGEGMEGTESVMTLLFYHLAPIVQNVSGAHWDLVWDVVENNLENCSFEDDATLTTLGRSLRLIILIEDLVKTNKLLKAAWAERRSAILSLVKDLVSAKSTTSNNAGVSAPRSLCRELAVSIIQDMPSDLVNENTLSEMCHFLSDPSAEVQKMSYRLLHEAARKRTENVVIEAAVDAENKVKIELPDELVVILQQTLSLDDIEQDSSEPDGASIQTHRYDVFGHMLGWMVAFDLFEGASLKVRTGYVQHLRNLGVVGKNFIPHIFEVLNLFDGRLKPFKLSIWEVDEYHLDYYDPDDFLSIRLFAAHLYHRALLTIPVLVRAWISDCTDKQLLSRVLDFTSSFFSPGIIRAELSLVRQAIDAPGGGGGAALEGGENMAIRVSNATSEVTASYTVDDQAIEFAVRMPADWPLHRLAIRDTRMPGVGEERWRAWVLGVQQTVWQQNGHIVDGLSMFTKNVKLHFNGLVECAICYSIICAFDGSTPAKPCRTCKNRFHAACLYKWFETSHSSSCPLCRSDIL